MRSKQKTIFTVCLCIAIVAVIILTGSLLYRSGYNKAIKSAQLIYADNYTYHIAYNGEIHQYDYEY